MSFETVIFEKKENIAYITLNRPQRLNIYNIQMRDDLWEVFGAIKADAEVRAVVLTGTGRAFCAGADLTEFGSAPSVVVARDVRFQRDLWGLLASIEQPIVVAINGFCMGSGIEMSMFCDIRIAAEEAQFGLPEVALGMVPAACGTQTVPRMIKPGWAMELMLLCDRISAQEAYRIGLVNRVVPLNDLMPAAIGLAQEIAAKSPIAVRAAKRAVNQGLGLTLAQGLELEMRLSSLILGSEDRIEGVRAFLEKRPPNFQGR